MPSRVVVLVSGAGTLLQALIDASSDPAYGVQVVAVGADRTGIAGLTRAESAEIPTFVVPLRAYDTRADWDVALAEHVGRFEPDLIVCAGFMKLFGAAFMAQYAGKIINSHPALLPSFPGAHGVRDALAHGVKVTGCTLFFVDEGIDTGPILAQRAVDVRPGDTEDTLHERIKVVERSMLVDSLRELAADPQSTENP